LSFEKTALNKKRSKVKNEESQETFQTIENITLCFVSAKVSLLFSYQVKMTSEDSLELQEASVLK